MSDNDDEVKSVEASPIRTIQRIADATFVARFFTKWYWNGEHDITQMVYNLLPEIDNWKSKRNERPYTYSLRMATELIHCAELSETELHDIRMLIGQFDSAVAVSEYLDKNWESCPKFDSYAD